MKTPRKSNKRRPQPHNVYNVFFLLERFRLIDTMTDASSSESETNQLQKSYDLDGYESLTLPDLPPRYQHLHLPMGWFVPGKNSKRKHAKSNNDSLPFFELARMVASNYKTIDKETKEYCATLSNLIKQRHGDLIAVFDVDGGIVVRAQEGQPEKKKEKLVQREVLSLATVKTNGDTNEHPMMAFNVPIIVHDARRKSPIITTSSVDPLPWPSNLTITRSTDTLGTFFDSTSSQDPKNGFPRLPFNMDYLDVQSTATHRVQAMDALNADIHGMMTEYGSNSGAEFQAIANVNRRAKIAGDMMTDLANVNRRALIIAEMMRSATIAADMIEYKVMSAYCMALNCKDEEESRPMTKINVPPRQLHLPYCQPIQDERGDRNDVK